MHATDSMVMHDGDLASNQGNYFEFSLCGRGPDMQIGMTQNGESWVVIFETARANWTAGYLMMQQQLDSNQFFTVSLNKVDSSGSHGEGGEK